MTQLSVIIPTYDRVDVLRRMLNLLTTQTLAQTEFEVIVIDDGSTDETPRLLREWETKGLLNLKWESQPNSGQGAARNRGIELATGEILLFLGDDMLPVPSLLEAHLKFHILYTEVTMGCLGLVEWHSELIVTRFMRWLTTSGIQFRFNDLKKGEQVDYKRFYTANISVKRELIGTERFDTDFTGWGYEDIELGYRLQRKGLKLIYTPEALVQHLHEITPANLSKRQFQAGKNEVLFARKHIELDLLPTGLALLVRRVLAGLLFFTYWGIATRARLAGIAAARREL